MRAFAITLDGNEISKQGYNNLIRSSVDVGNLFPIEKYRACTPYEANERISAGEVRWTYPWENTEIDFFTRLLKQPYATKNPLARIACFFSHYDLWKKCSKGTEEFLILEHDALFIKRFLVPTEFSDPFAMSLNDPRGATRRSIIYHDILQANSHTSIQKIPVIDDVKIPQGFPGNSAYFVNPSAAKLFVETVAKIGAWPNDALLCWQNFSFLRASSIYYTCVQGLRSTTTV